MIFIILLKSKNIIRGNIELLFLLILYFEHTMIFLGLTK